MDIPKAIEILNLNLNTPDASMPPDVHDALKLAVEALKIIPVYRTYGYAGLSFKLPGETDGKSDLR